MPQGTSAPLLVDRANARSAPRAAYTRRETISLIIWFAVFAMFAPALGIPPMFVILWGYRNANIIVHRICLVIALLLTVYAALFLSGVVTYIYWQ